MMNGTNSGPQGSSMGSHDFPGAHGLQASGVSGLHSPSASARSDSGSKGHSEAGSPGFASGIFESPAGAGTEKRSAAGGRTRKKRSTTKKTRSSGRGRSDKAARESGRDEAAAKDESPRSSSAAGAAAAPPSKESDAESPSKESSPRRKSSRKKAAKRTSRKRVSKKDADRAEAQPEREEAHDDEQRDAAANEEGASSKPEPRRRGSRKKTRRKSESDEQEKSPRAKSEKQTRGDEESVSPSEASSDDVASDSDSDDGPRRRRRRGRRGGRRRNGGTARSGAAGLSVEILPGEEDDLPELPELPEEAVQVDESRADGRKRSRKKAAKRETKKEPKPRAEKAPRKPKTAAAKDVGPPNVILVNAVDEEEKRVAVVCDGRIQDLQMTVASQLSLVNDIYRGRVVNLEHAIGAAFVDFGQGRNGFLHTSDVLPTYGDKDWSLDKLVQVRVDPGDLQEGARTAASPELTDDDDDDDDEPKDDQAKDSKKKGAPRRPRSRARPRLPITDLLKKGQMVVAQVTKEAIGDKGPTLTTYISIPGRYLVLMPTISRIGVSRKIEDEKERRRLKRILQSLNVPDGMGVIVRTAGIGHTKIDIKRDLEYLLHTWDHFRKRLSTGRGPSTLYEESDLAIRVLRDFFTEKTEAVYVDDPIVFEKLREFAERLMPESLDRIKLFEGPRPIFHAHGVEQDFEKIFSRRVELPSGGSIVFDQTEALVAIDVNSGKTRSDSFDFEKVALKTNMEALEEIARQIRLRDLGGIVVIDFIDMMRPTSMRQVERAFRAAIVPDRARSKVGRISQFGLLELTRQRLGPGITKKLFHPCTHCRGIGVERNESSRASAILRRLGSALTLKGFSKVEVRAHPEVIHYLDQHCADQLKALEHRHDRELILCEVPDQVEDSVLRYLRADGREVRPGGRRKR